MTYDIIHRLHDILVLVTLEYAGDCLNSVGIAMFHSQIVSEVFLLWPTTVAPFTTRSEGKLAAKLWQGKIKQGLITAIIAYPCFIFKKSVEINKKREDCDSGDDAP